ncbi:MAG TPA: AtpZ/AtpI family protein [Planctomycetota bacterium]|nr:AtpZ/AtpI family protein [Planctomycetota bacterium]
MTPAAERPATPEAEEPRLSRAVADYREHKADVARARGLAARVALVGSLGWLVVVPTLLGTWAGWRLDRRFESGIFWTAAGLMVGVSVGSYLLWRSLPGRGGA